jgi:hypothetical protein
MPAMVVGCCTRCWGAIGGGIFCISGVAGYDTPIWNVLAPQGERVGAGEHIYGARFVELSKLGKRCQLALLGLGFAPGLVSHRSL